MGVLRYTGPVPLKSDGFNHKPSIWYIADEERYRDSINSIDNPDGFAPYEYAFTKKGNVLYDYFSIARYDYRKRECISVNVGNETTDFYASTIKGYLPEQLNRTIEDFRMLCLDRFATDDKCDDVVHTLIFPTNRAFFHLHKDRLVIVGVYYGIDRNFEANTYSILINGDLYSGPLDLGDSSGFDWLENSIYRNIGEWRRNNGIR